jgi:hypothetical protein
VDKIKLEILGLSSSQSQIGSFALVLGEKDGNRRLPIIIGGSEAQAIALEIENIKPNRPMTHDLMLSLTQTFGITLQEVVISDLKEGVFFARLMMEQNGETKEIDSRPSDAIAIAVRHQAPIYTYENILEEAGIVIKEGEEEEEAAESSGGSGASASATSVQSRSSEEAMQSSEEEIPKDPSQLSDLKRAQLVKKLTRQMDEAINNEEYEKAARLRDEIDRLDPNRKTNPGQQSEN